METQTAPHKARVLGHAALKSRLPAYYSSEGLRKPLVTQRGTPGRPPQPGQHPRLGIWVMPSTKCYLGQEEEGLQVCQRKVVFSGAATRPNEAPSEPAVRRRRCQLRKACPECVGPLARMLSAGVIQIPEAPPLRGTIAFSNIADFNDQNGRILSCNLSLVGLKTSSRQRADDVIINDPKLAASLARFAARFERRAGYTQLRQKHPSILILVLIEN